MHRKWKKVSALGLAVLLGCLMPMSTMLAAEDDTEVIQEVDVDSDTDEASEDEVTSDENESVDADVNTDDEADAEDENVGDEADVTEESAGDEMNPEEENVVDEADADNEDAESIEIMSVTAGLEADGIEVQTAAPAINITLNGESCKVDSLGGDIVYKYTNSSDPRLKWSASRDGNPIVFYYYLDRTPGEAAMGADDIAWSDMCLSSVEQILSSNSAYVVYVKAEADGQTIYARSCGIVVDTTAPKIGGVEEGKTYPQGTAFTVEDANLDVVSINGSPVTPESDGSYRVITDGATCVISAKDKAGNEKTCSITVSGEKPAETTVISENGTYSLKANQKYRLAAGTWQVGGDSTVYQGGRTFYVTAAGDYSFTKR